MNRLTHHRCSGIKSGYWSPAKKDELVDRLARYENTGADPEQLIDSTDDNFQSVLICAVRYACGRQTYMPGIVIRFAVQLLPVLGDRTLSVLQRDIAEARDNNRLGSQSIDAPEWLWLLSKIEKEIARREQPEKEHTDDQQTAQWQQSMLRTFGGDADV